MIIDIIKKREKIPGFDQAGGMQEAALIDLTFNMGPAQDKWIPHLKKRSKRVIMNKRVMNWSIVHGMVKLVEGANDCKSDQG